MTAHWHWMNTTSQYPCLTPPAPSLLSPNNLTNFRILIGEDSRMRMFFVVFPMSRGDHIYTSPSSNERIGWGFDFRPFVHTTNGLMVNCFWRDEWSGLYTRVQVKCMCLHTLYKYIYVVCSAHQHTYTLHTVYNECFVDQSRFRMSMLHTHTYTYARVDIIRVCVCVCVPTNQYTCPHKCYPFHKSITWQASITHDTMPPHCSNSIDPH